MNVYRECRMKFVRQEAKNWANDVPGARWLKADLHVHTIDDLPGGRAKMPSDIRGGAQDSNVIEAYARKFLQSAAGNGVQVLGVTPHSPRIGDAVETSAVWRIVEEWNSGVDDDGVPFRKKVYAVFPGFEPALNDGKSGLHLLFLFDPEIGRANYLKAFDLVMGGVSPWSNNKLRMSNKSAEEAFRDLQEFHLRECPKTRDGDFEWSYIKLAPHIDSDKGLLEAQKAQVLELFRHDEVAALELGDHKLPEDTIENREWLREGMAAHRQAFLHGTDAYTVDDIGKRHTWVKLASPRIEALRQAFIASDSRVRIGFRREENGELKEIPNPPDVTLNKRPWLKSVTVSGKASFFGASDDGEQGSRFHFSPDLTCVIGGSMTGKSTLLDGLRVYVAAPLPHDNNVRLQVEERGKNRFLSGSAQVALDCPGRDPTAPLGEQWPAVFYTQTELQRLAQNSEAVEDVLARLVASETQGIMDREKRLGMLDAELTRAASRLAKLSDDLADAEQAFQRSQRASDELAAFSDAGVEKLNRASSDTSRWNDFVETAAGLSRNLDRLLDGVGQTDIPEIGEGSGGALSASGGTASVNDLRARWGRIGDLLTSARGELGAANADVKALSDELEAHEASLRVQVDRDLAARGLDGARINQLQELTAQASLLESYQAHLDNSKDTLESAERAFHALRDERKVLVEHQRRAFNRVIETVHAQFHGRIKARRLDEGRKENLDRFIRSLNQRGITRWWNDLMNEEMPTPDGLLGALDADALSGVGMSQAVQRTFQDQITQPKRWGLEAVRCRDEYALEFKMDDGRYRRLRSLSGGQRVNLLLSLLLETEDERPLVIDQPEDELDNRFLFETMLPALKRLKGRRQIIVATHNANIVVNGDADQVIQLEATADRGHVARSGAIEDPAVRDAIVRTVDGGGEAFRLRHLKYGF